MGILTNLGPTDILSDPDAFDPLDKDAWEWITDDIAPEEDTFSESGGSAFAAGWLKKHELLFHALSYFIGFSQLNGASTTRVTRHLPAAHPRWPFMRCTQVSVKGHEFAGQETPLRGHLAPDRGLRNPVYTRYRFDCAFEAPQMDMRADSESASEWDRFITVDAQDMGEVITVDGGQYKYYNAPGMAFSNQPAVIQGPALRAYAQRQGLLVTSYGLPANFILDENSIASHFLAAKGKVNSATFLGKAPGTMLLLDYKITKRAHPIATRNIDELSFGVKVEMQFGFTDPPRGEPTETLRGWQLVPGIRGFHQAWYGVKTDAGDTLYDTYDMHKLLQLHSS